MAKKSSKKKMPGSSAAKQPAAKPPGAKPAGAGPVAPHTRSTAPKGRPTAKRNRPNKKGRGLNWVVGLVAVTALVVVAVVAFSGTGTSGAGVTDPAKFDLPALDGGKRVKLADLRGKPLVVNFFASWCTACDAELPGFAKVSQELKGKVQFAGVNSLETGDKNLMPERHGITWWPLAADINGSQASGLHDALGGGNSMPLTAFYDANGKLVNVVRGEEPESTLRQTIQQLYGVAS